MASNRVPINAPAAPAISIFIRFKSEYVSPLLFRKKRKYRNPITKARVSKIRCRFTVYPLITKSIGNRIVMGF